MRPPRASYAKLPEKRKLLPSSVWWQRSSGWARSVVPTSGAATTVTILLASNAKTSRVSRIDLFTPSNIMLCTGANTIACSVGIQGALFAMRVDLTTPRKGSGHGRTIHAQRNHWSANRNPSNANIAVRPSRRQRLSSASSAARGQLRLQALHVHGTKQTL